MSKVKKDNWENRQDNMMCIKCMHYSPKKNSVGRCRRHAPAMVGFPVVFDTDWCGDFRLNENSVKGKL